jgi:hypothetical protein
MVAYGAPTYTKGLRRANYIPLAGLRIRSQDVAGHCRMVWSVCGIRVLFGRVQDDVNGAESLDGLLSGPLPDEESVILDTMVQGAVAAEGK